MNAKRLGSSFRDPSGFMFHHDGVLYRQINLSYKDEYDQLISSGLYDRLVKDSLLIPHEETSISPVEPDLAYKVIRPHEIPFISYPYEWCFSQLKDAALLTLKIQRIALKYGMSLKDCSAFNIQFLGSKPIFIDTLSFESYLEGQPWVPYRQFCQHFLATLALMSYTDLRLNTLLNRYLDGIPLDLTVRLLPYAARFNLSLYMHLYLHAKVQKQVSGRKMDTTRKMSLQAHLGLLDSLESAVKRLKTKNLQTTWSGYYQDTNYTTEGMEHKKKIIEEWIDQIRPKTVLDLGANIGNFSKLASQRDIYTIAVDSDPGAVELAYQDAKSRGDKYLLPLVIDLTNPTPAIGWENQERKSFIDRCSVDLVMALALIHHLAIGNNLPLENILDVLAKLGKWLIVEFVPKEDSQVQKMLANRKDIFENYNIEQFENYITEKHIFKDKIKISNSNRVLFKYLKNF